MHFHDDLLDSDASVSYSSPRKTAEKSASGQGLDADFSVSYESFSLFYVALRLAYIYSFTQRTW